MLRAITSIAIFCASIFAFHAPSIATANHFGTGSPKASSAVACPFCSAISLTFSEQLNSNDIAVVAKLIEIPPPNNNPNADFPKATFEIVQVLKGEKFVGQTMTFKTQLVGLYPKGQKFLVMGVDPPKVAWTTPMKATDRVFSYLDEIQTLPESGPERLVYFQDYFEDKESVLAFDAYDEFARAPYDDLIAIKDQMDRDKLLSWIQNPETSVSRKRLYYTMLGVCGKAEDTKLLEELINSGNRKKRAGLDALIACYLNLKGESGVDLIEKTFLADHEVDYVDTLAAVSALRFHGTELELISKERIVVAVRHLLDRPKMADMIIPDLARWEDWSVMERLVKMFKEADTDSNWLRVPVITYLRACPKPEAKLYIEELRKIDPESVQRADFFLGVGDSDDDWDDEPETTSPKTDNDKTDVDKSDAGSTDAGSTDAGSTDAETTDAEELQKKLDKKKAEIKSAEIKTAAANNEVVDTTGESEKHFVKKVIFDSDEQDNLSVSTYATATEVDSKIVPSATGTTTVSPHLAPPAELNAKRVATPNPNTTMFVSSTADSMAAQSTPVQVAQTVTSAVPVAATTPRNLTWEIILIPMAISVAIFLLLWSVVNGWFERLIF